MIELIRNCTHGTEVAIYREEVDGKRGYIKVAVTPEGVATLRAELKGWAWYQALRWPDRTRAVCRMTQSNDHALRIELDDLGGTRADVHKGLAANAAVIDAVIDQYCSFWIPDACGGAPMHGDLSLDNVLCLPDGPAIIDWEHFRESGVPWGFDAVHLICECLYFGRQSAPLPSPRDLRIAARLLSRLDGVYPLPAGTLHEPLAFVRNFIKANAALWGEQLARHAAKLPVFAMDEAAAAGFDAALARQRAPA